MGSTIRIARICRRAETHAVPAWLFSFYEGEFASGDCHREASSGVVAELDFSGRPAIVCNPALETVEERGADPPYRLNLSFNAGPFVPMQSFVRRVAAGGGLVVLLVLFGCGSDGLGIIGGGGGGAGQTCTLSIGPKSTSIPLRVRYSSSLSGNIEITLLRYATNQGTQTVRGVTESWSKTVDLDGGEEVKMSATAKVVEGEAKISYAGRDSTGTRVVGAQDLCSAN